MKSIIVAAMVLASGIFGWSLRNNHTSVVLTQTHTGDTAHDPTKLYHTGDIMFHEVVRSSLWIRTEQGGNIGTKHAFVSTYEHPPMSGKFFVGKVVIFDRPDLTGILQEDIRHGVQNVRAWVEIHGHGQDRVPVLVAQTGDRNRIITIPESQFPETATNLVKFVLPYAELLGSGE